MSTKRFVFFHIVLIGCSPLLGVGQPVYSIPQQIELSDSVLLNAIKKYQPSVLQEDVMVVSLERHQDTVKYYITTINSMYRLTRNIPVVYTKLADHYILLYSGIEPSVKISDEGRKHFLSLFRAKLTNDLLADGKTWNPRFLGTYDPMQVLLIVKAGKKVYEDFKKGFGPTGIPFLDTSR